MLKKLINYFRKPFNLCALIGIPLGMIISYAAFNSIGLFTPPTEEDYSDLYEQAELIAEDYENIYLFDNIKTSVLEEEIIVEIISKDNSDYLVKMKFSKEKKFISIEEISNRPGFQTYPLITWVDKAGLLFSVGFFGLILGMVVNIAIYEGYKLKKKYKNKEQN